MKGFKQGLALLCLAVVLALPAYGAQGENIVGKVQVTGIVARIDGQPLRSYNVNGRTAVVVMDLVDYGFNVIWDGAERTLWVERGAASASAALQAKQAAGVAVALDTDVTAYVAGEQVDCFTLNGENAIYLSELTRYGTLRWLPQEQAAQLDTAQDPMQWALEQKKAELSALGDSFYQEYPGEEGTLLVCGQSQTARGKKTEMLFVERNGTRVSLTGQMPQTCWGAEYYVSPSEVQYEQDGDVLTFITPLRGTADGLGQKGADQLSWGTVRCRYDIQRRVLSFVLSGTGDIASSLERAQSVMQLCQPLREWWESTDSASWYQLYEREEYTLFYGQYAATPYGVSTQLVLVREDGSTVDLIAQLPDYEHGASYYVQIQELSVPENGSAVTFRTRVPGEKAGQWAQALCSLDISAGKLTVTLTEAEPVQDPAGELN